MGDSFFQREIYQFKTDNEGKFIKTQSYSKDSKEVWHFFLILSNNRYNRGSSHYLAVCLSTSPTQYYGLELDPDAFENGKGLGRTNVLCDKVTRMDASFINKDHATFKRCAKITEQTYNKVITKINEFIKLQE